MNRERSVAERVDNQLGLSTEQRNVVVDGVADDVVLDVEVGMSEDDADAAISRQATSR